MIWRACCTCLAVLLAVCAFVGAGQRDRANHLAARLEFDRAAWATERAAAAASAARLTAALAATTEGVYRDAEKGSRATVAHVSAAAVAGSGLRQRAAAGAAAACTGGAGTEAGGQDAGQPGAVYADVLAGLESAGRQLAQVADERGVALQACEAAYDGVAGLIGDR